MNYMLGDAQCIRCRSIVHGRSICGGLDCPRNVTLWPKTVATITDITSDGQLMLRTESGERRSIYARQGYGGRMDLIRVGTRIKIYKRDNATEENFRMVGR